MPALDKVAIIAAGPTWTEAPYGDPSFERWGLNAFHRMKHHGHCTRWLQLHKPGSGEGHIDDVDHIMWLKESHDFPIYMLKHYDDYPSSVAYPYEDVVKSFCPESGAYFTNSVDYMVCLAMLEGFKEIHLFGTDFIADEDDDYYKRRQSLEFYCGQAKGLGIKVVIPEDCALLKAEYVYGYNKKPRDNDETIKRLIHMRSSIHTKRLEAQDKYLREKAAMDKAEGAIGILDQLTFDLRMRKRGLPT
jgi:hypothetical protein